MYNKFKSRQYPAKANKKNEETMNNSSRSLRATVALSIVVASAGARASPILDQSFEENISATGGSQGIAQTFTVGVTGTLTRVDIFAEQLTAISLGILGTTGGVPTPFSAALGTVPLTDIPFTGFGSWVSVDVSALNISVTSGDLLAWALVGTQAQVGGSDFLVPGDRYTGGEAFSGRTIVITPGKPPVFFPPGEVWAPALASPLVVDLAFHTYVEPTAVPEPSTLALLAAGALMLLPLRRRSSSTLLRGLRTTPTHAA